MLMMTSRFNRQPSNILEIRGISRGSLVDHPRIETVGDVPSRELDYLQLRNHALDADSDDEDESTIVAGSIEIRSVSPQSPTHSDDTATASETSHYWSAGRSFTTGNTTERSSVYSWGDDIPEFDVQTSRMVRAMFQAIERMLFEGVLSGSTSLQQECREWMEAFPHLRILGKQIFPFRDDGFQPVASPSNHSSFEHTPSYASDVLEIQGSSVTPLRLPQQAVLFEAEGGSSSSKSEVSHLYEEVFAKDGTVEEYLAYDIRELDDEEHVKKYHVPRRRRLGFPPITPNACVRDAVLQQVFDLVWMRVVSCLASPTNNKSLLKVLVENMSWSRDNASQSMKSSSSKHASHRGRITEPSSGLKFAAEDREEQPYTSVNYDGDDNMYGRWDSSLQRRHTSNTGPLIPPFYQRQLYPDLGLPPSRGSYLDQAFTVGRPNHFTPGRLSTAPHFHNHMDINSLNDVIKISQKKLQSRADRPISDDTPADSLQDLAARYSTITPNGPSNPSSQLISVVGNTGTASPVSSAQKTVSKEFRQPSGQGRKGRGVSRFRLMPLDRAKTPNIDHNLNVTATKLVPGPVESPAAPFSGTRVNSPNALQPPPSVPNPSIGSGSMWMARLPPISSSLEALPENTPSDFKKTRGRTAHARVASAIGEESSASRMIESLSRPNTTHTFRTENLVSKRSSSVTPSNLQFTPPSAQVPGMKSLSPAGFFSSSTSPDHHFGLAGITGKSMNLNNVFQSSPPDDAMHSSWGLPFQSNPQPRKKRSPTS